MALVGFLIFIAIFLITGLVAGRKQDTSGSAYLLAGQSLHPLPIALSAAATKYSGYMFIGLMGYIYLYGLSGVWLMLGFLFGDLITFTRIPAVVSQQTARLGVLSFSQLISAWYQQERPLLRFCISTLTLVFLSTYAAAQLNAGGKALQVLLNWNFKSGALAGALLIVIYCLKGGIKASIWTDAIQSIVMLIAMSLLLYATLQDIGSWSLYINKLDNISDTYLDLGSERFGSLAGLCLFAVGWLFNGLGVTGQPQVMVRFMALDRPEHSRQMAIYYLLWSSAFLVVTFLVGLATRLYVAAGDTFDAELALPLLSQQLLPGILSGIVLAGIFSASVSTADSQVLSSSAVLSEDFGMFKNNRWRRQYTTLLVILLSLIIVYFLPLSVFTLVIVAWSVLSAAIGPLLIIQSFGGKFTELTAILMMSTGIVVTLLWRYLGLHTQIYEGAPGMISAFLMYGLSKIIARIKS